jgi:hypothetical protein
MRKISFLLLALLFCGEAFAQEREGFIVGGRVLDAADSAAVPGVHVVLTNLTDTTRQVGALSGANGMFVLRGVPRGNYRLRLSYVGYRPYERTMEIGTNQNLGTLVLRPDVAALDELIVEERQERVILRGDTTEYNADAYRVRRDASAEELVTRMPGITVENGRVQARGEDVRRVTLDGQEFFGQDAILALRNLPAEIIDRIQVFDRLGDQAAFTGFDDGSGERTINIVTRAGRSQGQFGRAYGGYGADDRYTAGGNVSIFQGTRRISLVGMTNNVNQQNFAQEDLVGATGGGGRGGWGGMAAMFGGGGGRGGMRGGGGGGSWGGGEASNFLTSAQGGINTTHSIGLNYQDRFGERLRLSGSYFFNATENATDNALGREYFLTGGMTQLYDESSVGKANNLNHRLNSRIEFQLNENQSFIVTPRLSWQRNENNSTVFGLTRTGGGNPMNQTYNESEIDNTAYNASANVLFRQRFTRPGRTFSANVNLNANDRSGSSLLEAQNIFYRLAAVTGDPDAVEAYRQRIEDLTSGLSVNTNMTWTERSGENGQWQFNYGPSWSFNTADRGANRYDELTGGYTLPVANLTSEFDNTVFRQRAGASYRLRGEKYNFSLGMNYQMENLTGDQVLPTPYQVDQTFHTIQPTAQLQYRFRPTRTLNLNYRTFTNTPSINQLRDVIDNTNPLSLTGGNPDLDPSFTHLLFARFNNTNLLTGRVFMGFASVSGNTNPIGNASIVAERDIELREGIILPRGAQFVYPVNLDGVNLTARSFLTYGLPVDLVKSNLNLMGGLTYSRTNGLINNTANLSNVYNVMGGFVLGSNISERIDFSLTNNATYNFVENTIDSQRDGNFLTLNSRARVNWLPREWVNLESDLGYQQYSGLSGGFDQQMVIWNAGIGYRFLEDNVGELKLMVYDILNQNDSINRTVNELFIEDRQTQVLGRYVMLNFTYRIRNFQR